MTEQYSYKRAAAWTGAGVLVSGLAAVFEAAVHHGWDKSFDSFAQAFAHVAQPSDIAIAIGVSVIFGVGMEFRRWHNRRLDREEKDQTPPAPGL